jgi:hypothetical protein
MYMNILCLVKRFFWLVHHFRTFGLIISSTCNFPPLNKIFFGTTMILLMFKSSIVFEIVANQPQRQCNYQYTNSFLIFFIYFASAVMAAGQEEGAGGRGGSPAYSKMELLHLLDIMERIIPVSGEEWDQVDVHHCTLYPVRKAKGLQCKFQGLYRKTNSTGDPDCPLSVKHAKLLRRTIIERCEVDDAEVEEVVQYVGDMELLSKFPGIQCLHEIAEDSGKEGVVDPPQAPAPQTNAEVQPPPAETSQPAAVEQGGSQSRPSGRTDAS